MIITQAYLQSILDYNRFTGWFTWRVRQGTRSQIGERAGSYDAEGYRVIQLNGSKYKEHRLVWLYVHANWPNEIDHKNGKRGDNRLDNLRDVDHTATVINSERAVGVSGLRGVKFDPKTSKWRSRIGYGYQRVWLGPFDTAEEAYAAYLAAAEKVHGQYAVHNRPQTLIRRI